MIPYLGDKSKYANFIIPNIPTNISTYCEPFGGMFGIYFSLDLNKYKNTKFVYNDINFLNSNLIEHLQEEKFISYLESIKIDEDFYKIAKLSLYDCSNIEMAVYWLVLLTCSNSQFDILNGEFRGSSAFEIFKIKLKYSNNYPGIIVNNNDYKIIMNQYDSSLTFFYIDPPYFNKESYYINHNFTIESHENMSIFLKSIKGKFMISYLDFPNLKEWYGEYNIKYFNTLMGKETLIMNY